MEGGGGDMPGVHWYGDRDDGRGALGSCEGLAVDIAQRLSESLQATNDFNTLLRLLKLDSNTAESRGILLSEVAGPIVFNHVGCSSRALILNGVNLEIADRNCVAMVGPSGAGKYILATLLQRLYEPDSECITIGSTDIAHLRHHISVISQNPNLFDTTIAENMRYDNKSVSIRKAAKAANVCELRLWVDLGWTLAQPSRGLHNPECNT
jgi:ATP-binding cassette, subfamily B (MDR/TAP), member 1